MNHHLVRFLSILVFALGPSQAEAAITAEILVPGAMCALDDTWGPGTVAVYNGRTLASLNYVTPTCIAPSTRGAVSPNPATVDRAEMYVYDASQTTQDSYRLCFEDLVGNTFCGTTVSSGISATGTIWLLMPRPSGTFNARWMMYLTGQIYQNDFIISYAFQDCTAPSTYCP